MNPLAVIKLKFNKMILIRRFPFSQNHKHEHVRGKFNEKIIKMSLVKLNKKKGYLKLKHTNKSW